MKSLYVWERVPMYFKVFSVRKKENLLFFYYQYMGKPQHLYYSTFVLGHLFISLLWKVIVHITLLVLYLEKGEPPIITHYIASSKLDCETQDEIRKWVMPRIISLHGEKFRRKNRCRKACEMTFFVLMWTVWEEKNRKRVRELKVLMYMGNHFILCSLRSPHHTPTCQGLDVVCG